MAKKQTTSKATGKRKKVDHQYQSMPKTYSLIKEIREDNLYKSNIRRRDRVSRKIIDEHGKPSGVNNLVAGNLYLIKYFYPKTEEQLEYYDAWPCSLIFGKFKTKKGEPRILGFSIHYFPPRIRFQVLNKVMEIYKEIYKDRWKSGLKKDLSFLEYKQLVYLLQKAKLAFAVHEYIPNLIGDCIQIPPSLWHIAVFTEGQFKKKTREAIMKYWKSFKP